MISLAVVLVACAEGRRASSAAESANVVARHARADTLALARAFAQLIAWSDTLPAHPLYSQEGRPAPAVPRAAAAEDAWGRAVLRELYILRPALFDSVTDPVAAYWLGIQPLTISGDSATAAAGWVVCDGKHDVVSTEYVLVRAAGTARSWTGKVSSRSLLSLAGCTPPTPALPPE